MHKNSFRNQMDKWVKCSLAITLFGAISTLMSACGGGGVTSISTGDSDSALQVLPGTADIFPQVPTVFTISGGKPGYTVFSSNSVALPIPDNTIVGSKFTVVANSVATSTAVTLTIKDTAGVTTTVTANILPAVINNTVKFTPLAPTGTGCGGGLCSGGDAQVVVTAIENGIVLKNRPIRFDVFQGDFKFVTPGTELLVNSLTILTDEQGEAVARLRATLDTPTQVATLNSTDTTSGLVRRFNFNIIQQTSGQNIISTLPSGNTTFNGAKPPAGFPAQCPTGFVDYYIYGGTPPYTVASPLPQLLSVVPSIVTVNGGSFRVTLHGCGKSQLIVTDALNRTVETSQVIGEQGPAGDAVPTPPASTVTAAPTTHNVGCGQTATSTLAGNGTYTATVTTPGIPPAAFTFTPTTGAIPGSISFTRRANDGVAQAPVPASITVNVVAGTTTVPITINVPVHCP